MLPKSLHYLYPLNTNETLQQIYRLPLFKIKNLTVLRRLHKSSWLAGTGAPCLF